MQRAKLTEERLARAVVEYLRGTGWEVYQEVQVTTGGAVADIVAVRGGLVHIIECKTSLNLDLLAQALHWRYWVHHVSIAVPAPAKQHVGPGRALALSIAESRGVGVLLVHVAWRHWETDRVSETHAPRLIRRPGPPQYLLQNIRKLRSALCAEQKDFVPAGTASGRCWTPWQATMRRVSEIVRKQPGIRFKELLDTHGIFHYASRSSARAGLSKWLWEGKVPDVVVRQEGRELRLYPTKD